MKFLNLVRLLALPPLLMALTQCDRVEALFKPKAAKPGPYAFDVILKMSPKGEAALKQNPDGLLVDAWYYGLAAPAHKAEADEVGRIYLGDERWGYPGNARQLHLNGTPLDTSKLSLTTDGQPLVLLTVDGGGSPDDLLSCQDYIGPISLAQKHTPVLRCEFGSERYWDSVGRASASE